MFALRSVTPRVHFGFGMCSPQVRNQMTCYAHFFQARSYATINMSSKLTERKINQKQLVTKAASAFSDIYTSENGYKELRMLIQDNQMHDHAKSYRIKNCVKEMMEISSVSETNKIINQEDEHGFTLLDYAVGIHRLDGHSQSWTVGALLNSGASPRSPDNGFALLRALIQDNYMHDPAKSYHVRNFVKKMMAISSDSEVKMILNREDEHGYTLLDYAVGIHRLEGESQSWTIGALIESGASPRSVDNAHILLRALIKDSKYFSMADWLIQYDFVLAKDVISTVISMYKPNVLHGLLENRPSLLKEVDFSTLLHTCCSESKLEVILQVLFKVGFKFDSNNLSHGKFIYDCQKMYSNLSLLLKARDPVMYNDCLTVYYKDCTYKYLNNQIYKA